MSGQGEKYTEEDLMELGRMNVEEDKSIRELAKEFGVSKSTVSKAKDIYLSYQEGKINGKNEKKQEMEGKISRLEERIERLSAKPKEDKESRGTEIDPCNYAKDSQQDAGDQNENESLSGGWIVAGLGALLGMVGILLQDWWR